MLIFGQVLKNQIELRPSQPQDREQIYSHYRSHLEQQFLALHTLSYERKAKKMIDRVIIQ